MNFQPSEGKMIRINIKAKNHRGWLFLLEQLMNGQHKIADMFE